MNHPSAWHGSFEYFQFLVILAVQWYLSWSWMSKKKSKKYKSWSQVCQSIHLCCIALSKIYIFTCLQLCWSALLESPNHLKTNQQSKMNLQLLSTDNSYMNPNKALHLNQMINISQLKWMFGWHILMFWIFVAYFRPKIGVSEYSF